jgi:hypothetical protein
VIGSILIWLPLIRGLTQGRAYSWTLVDGIGGRGVGGHYWALVPLAAALIALLYLGERGARLPFHALVLMLHLPLGGAVLYAALVHPEALRFEGATMGIDLSLIVIGPVLFGGFAILALFWVIRDLRHGQRRSAPPWLWTRRNRIRLALVIGLLPVEAVLFRSGGIASPMNIVGVGLVFWQWTMLHLALRPASIPVGQPERSGG